MRPPRAGKYNRSVTLQTPTTPETYDSFGQPVQAWTTIGVFGASIRPLIGREAVVAHQIKAEATHVIEMRYNPAFTMNPLNQLTYTKPGFPTRTFGISQVLNVEEANVEFYILVQEILTQATQA